MTRNSHWDLQTKQIFLPLQHYSDVIRFERLHEGLATFLDRLGIDPGVTERSDALRHGRAHRTNAHDRLHQFYSKESADIVQRLFAKDFEALGYAPDWPPDD